DQVVGAWAPVLFATLPGVSLSAILLAPDVPLLFFWALALLALWRLVNGGGNGSAAMLGLMVGLATLSKYAGLYFVPCVIAYMAADRAARAALMSKRGALALGVALVALAP